VRLNVEVGDRPCCSRGDPSQQWGPITAMGTRHSSEKRSACQLLVMDLDVLVGDRQGSSEFSDLHCVSDGRPSRLHLTLRCNQTSNNDLYCVSDGRPSRLHLTLRCNQTSNNDLYCVSDGRPSRLHLTLRCNQTSNNDL